MQELQEQTPEKFIHVLGLSTQSTIMHYENLLQSKHDKQGISFVNTDVLFRIILI